MVTAHTQQYRINNTTPRLKQFTHYEYNSLQNAALDQDVEVKTQMV
jgi:4-diphosphocytidyl-2C-methyl-D-erythritol kinase